MAARRVVVHYPRHLIEAPLISQMVRRYDLEFNILRATITPRSEGIIVLGLEGDEGSIRDALDWAEGQGLQVQPLEKDVIRDEKRCTQCGACVTICPTGALSRYLGTEEVDFSPDDCVACELCVPACPPRAMRVAL
jgi:ferredoxin